MKRISLELSLEEINLILSALGQQPYTQVAALIAKISEQCKPQIKDEQQEQQG